MHLLRISFLPDTARVGVRMEMRVEDNDLFNALGHGGFDGILASNREFEYDPCALLPSTRTAYFLGNWKELFPKTFVGLRPGEAVVSVAVYPRWIRKPPLTQPMVSDDSIVSVCFRDLAFLVGESDAMEAINR